MARPRTELQAKLEALLGTKSVHFQPPATVRLRYPCIIYKLDARYELYADNRLYRHLNRYLITIIDRDPDSGIPDQVAGMEYCSFERFYTADGLNHWIFDLYF